jgi:protein required for attachment to host cells
MSHDPIDDLRALARELRHVEQQHAREAAGGTSRRRLRAVMEEITIRFVRLLATWVSDGAARNAWMRHLRGRAPAPEQSMSSPPPLFRGITEAGASVELRSRGDSFYDVLVDGAVVRHEEVPWHLDPDRVEPIQIGEYICREVFGAPDAAVTALVAFVAEPQSEPPRAWARALYEDGLIDRDFGLTARGRRLLSRAPAAGSAQLGIIVADAARARILVLRTTHGELAPTLSPLIEVAQLTAPVLRTRDRDAYSDTRPGLSRASPGGPAHAFSDRREGHRRSDTRHFAQQLLVEAERAWRRFHVERIVVVASPVMLGILRPLLSHPAGLPRSELARDLTQLTLPALHDALAAAGMIPARRRRPPLLTLPGAPSVARR